MEENVKCPRCGEILDYTWGEWHCHKCKVYFKDNGGKAVDTTKIADLLDGNHDITTPSEEEVLDFLFGD